PDQPLAVLREVLQLLRRLGAGMQGGQPQMVRAQEVGGHPGIKQVALRAALPEAIPGPVQRLGIDRVDEHAVVQQKVHHAPLGALDRGPELDPPGAPFVQLPAPLAQALGRVRRRAGRDRLARVIDPPDGMRLIRPIDPKVVAHHASRLQGRVRAGTAGCPYTGPRGDHFLLNLMGRSLAGRDRLSLSLRGLRPEGSSGPQALTAHAAPRLLTLHPLPDTPRPFSPGFRAWSEYKDPSRVVSFVNNPGAPARRGARRGGWCAPARARRRAGSAA